MTSLTRRAAAEICICAGQRPVSGLDNDAVLCRFKISPEGPSPAPGHAGTAARRRSGRRVRRVRQRRRDGPIVCVHERSGGRHRGQPGATVAAAAASRAARSHPRTAVLLAAPAGCSRPSDRPLRRVLSAGGAVLLLGSRWACPTTSPTRPTTTVGPRASRWPSGDLPRGSASYWMMVLLLAARPALAVQRLLAAAVLCLVLAGRRWCTTTGCTAAALSWLGWVLAFALLPAFLAYGSWARQPRTGRRPRTPSPRPPRPSACACTSRPRSATSSTTTSPGAQPAPAVALRTGAPRLLLLTAAASALARRRAGRGRSHRRPASVTASPRR